MTPISGVFQITSVTRHYWWLANALGFKENNEHKPILGCEGNNPSGKVSRSSTALQ